MNDLDLPGLEASPVGMVPPPAAVATSGRARVKPIDRSQITWRPIDVQALIEQDHPARAIWALSGRLALEGFYAPIQAVEGVAGRMPWGSAAVD